MAKKPKHSPTPWRAAEEEYGGTIILDADGERVLDQYCIDPESQMISIHPDNMAFLIEAVNHHDCFLALKKAMGKGGHR